MEISEFVGNDFLKEQFISMSKNKKIPHAIILEGKRGIGKGTFAEIIAKLILCSYQDKTPCEKCLNCQKINKKVHPDVIYPEISGTLETYNIDTVRKIREDAFILPNESDYKIYILKNADNMNRSAQNALLKILEEPPSHVVFIFTCEERSVFLETIRSRAQIFSLHNVDERQAVSFISKNYPNFDLDKIKAAAKQFRGNIGQAIQSLSLSSDDGINAFANEIACALIRPNEFELLSVISKIKTNRNLLDSLLNALILIFRDALVLKSAVDVSNDKICAKLSESLSREKLLELIDLMNEISYLSLRNVNQNLLLTYLSSSLYSIAFCSN